MAAKTFTTTGYTTPRPDLASGLGSIPDGSTSPNGAGQPAEARTTSTSRAPVGPARFAPLVSAVAEWQLIQTTRIKVELPAKALTRAEEGVPMWLLDTLARLTAAEKTSAKRILAEWETHPLAPWAETVYGFGAHSAAIIVGLLEGDPYIAYPRRRVGARGSSRFVWEEPYARTLGQLKAYCGYGNPDRKREAGMGQADLLALGKPYLKARLRVAAENLLKSGNREVYDEAKAAVSERDWTDGHKHAHALRVVVKKLILPGLYDEAKRLHETGKW